MSIGNLVANLTMSTAGFSAGAKNAQATVGSLTSNINASMASIIGALSPVTAAFSGAFAIGNAIAGAKEALEAQNKLAAVLTATGGAAGLTAEQVSDLAGELQGVTNFEGDATVAAAAMLATFREIKGATFTAAIESAMDLSTVMGQDLNASIVQIGKALNDPIKGITALGRVGVSFTEQQKAQIRVMTEAGDVAGAQQIILKELAAEFGGAARAVADPWKVLLNTLGDVSENIGAALLPTVNSLSIGVKAMLQPLANASDLFTATGTTVAKLVAGLTAYAAVMGVIKVATLAYASAQRAATAAAIIFQGVMNPALLLKVGAGIAAAGIAIASMDSVLAATGTSAGAATSKIAGLRSAVVALDGAADNTNETLDRLSSTLNQWQAGGAGERIFATDDLFGSGLTKAQEEAQRLNGLLQDVRATADMLGQARFESFTKQITDQIGKVTGITAAIETAKRELGSIGQSDSLTNRSEVIGRFAEAGATGQQLVELDQLLSKIDFLKDAQEQLKKSMEIDASATSKITDLKDELDVLRGVATETDIAMRQLGREGFNADQIAQIKALAEQRDALLAQQKTENKATSAVGLRLSGAAELGSAQAASIIANSVAKGRDPVADNTKKMVELQQRTLTALQEKPTSLPLIGLAVLS